MEEREGGEGGKHSWGHSSKLNWQTAGQLLRTKSKKLHFKNLKYSQSVGGGTQL